VKAVERAGGQTGGGEKGVGEEIERRASDAKLILETAAKHGVPVEMLWKPS